MVKRAEFTDKAQDEDFRTYVLEAKNKHQLFADYPDRFKDICKILRIEETKALKRYVTAQTKREIEDLGIQAEIEEKEGRREARREEEARKELYLYYRGNTNVMLQKIQNKYGVSSERLKELANEVIAQIQVDIANEAKQKGVEKQRREAEEKERQARREAEEKERQARFEEEMKRVREEEKKREEEIQRQRDEVNKEREARDAEIFRNGVMRFAQQNTDLDFRSKGGLGELQRLVSSFNQNRYGSAELSLIDALQMAETFAVEAELARIDKKFEKKGKPVTVPEAEGGIANV